MESDERTYFEKIGEALMVGGIAVAYQLPGISSSPEAQGALAVVGPALGFALVRGCYDAFASRRASFVEGYVKAFDTDPNGAKEHAESQRENPDYHETMYRSFRLMMDAADPSVIDAIGYLAGQYSIANKKPDSHFRRLGRLLSELEAGQLEDLKQLLNGVVTAIYEFRSKDYKDLSSCSEDFYVTWSDEKQHHLVDMHTGSSRYMTVVEAMPAAEWLVWVLKREGFGEILPENRHVITHSQSMSMTYENAQKILSTVDPKPVT